MLTRLFTDRGVKLERTYQLNFGGNTDFLNMLERDRLMSKKISKTRSVTSQIDYDIGADNVHIGPSDYVPWLHDRKWAYIRLEGRGFGDVPLNVELKLEVHDSPNSAGIVIDAVRCCKLALDRGIGGALEGPSSYFMKSPPVQYSDNEAKRLVEEFIDGGKAGTNGRVRRVARSEAGDRRCSALATGRVRRVVRALPPGFRHAVAAPGGAAWYWLSARAAARRAGELRRGARPRPAPTPRSRASRGARFRTTGGCSSTSCSWAASPRRSSSQRMTVDGREHLDAALAGGRGAIMAVPHMGSWDMAGSYAGALGYPICAVAERFPGSLNDAVVRTRQRFGLERDHAGPIGGPRRSPRRSQANGIVALLCDLEQGPGVDVRFFGRRAVVPGGPAAIALKTGAALMPACQYVSRARPPPHPPRARARRGPRARPKRA